MSVLNTKVIFCDNEHGTGDVTFPDLSKLEPEDFQPPALRAAILRKKAKAEGWGRVQGGDYCPGCMESM